MNEYDVIVVGAGPAGSTAARICALHNLKTLVLEKEKIPREKPCAGGVTVAAAKALDFPIPENLIERKCKKLSVVYERIQNRTQLDKPFVYMVDRKKFDGFLADRAAEAGAIIQEREQCLFVEADDTHVTVRTDKKNYTAGVVIGADGVYSRVLKSLYGGFNRDEIHLCVTSEIPMPDKEIDRRFGDLVTIYYGFESIGYAWLFPKGGYVSAGIGIQEKQSKNIVNRLKDFLKLKNLDTDVRIRGYYLPVSKFTRPVYGKRAMLVGDAAGFTDGFSGEGIRYAILSGRTAAETAIQAHSSGDFSEKTIRQYQDTCESIFIGDLRCAAKMTKHIGSYRNFLFETALQDKTALARYLETVTGNRSICDFLRWIRERSPFLLTKRLIFGVNIRKR
jgi:geranylgeranyl reductase family protein